MKPRVLILSSPSDGHAKAVAKHLEAAGVTPTYWSAKDLLKQWAVNFSLSDTKMAWTAERSVKSGCADGSDRIDLQAFNSVWLRRPETIKSLPMPESWMEEFVEHESNRALEAMFSLTAAEAQWINPPVAERNARFKIVQLETAKQCGLAIPETLVTNDPEAAREFYHSLEGQVIYKLIDERSGNRLPYLDGAPGLSTLPMREVDLQHIGQVAHCMHLFQRRIDKQFDLRITAVGDQLHAATIDSQSGRGNVDFRLDFSVPMHVHRLPDNISERCLQMMKKLGLVFGAIDMTLDKQGRYQFLEVNPAGQWRWIEDALNLPISRDLARLLAAPAQ